MKTFYISILVLYCIISSSLRVFAQPSFPSEAEKAKLIYSDIENFVDAYSQIKINSDTVQILQELYLDKGSTGLKEFEARHGLTALTLKKAIRKYPKYYSSIKGFLSEIKKFNKGFVEELSELKKVHNKAAFPPTYLVVGSNRGVAQASQVGGLITIERNTQNWDKLYTLIIHELVHFQQALSMGFDQYSAMYSKKNNMLDTILREGGAEFVTYYLVRKNPEELPNNDLFDERKQELWARFKKDLEKQDKDYWLWNVDENGVSIALGYTLGARICEAYYSNAVNKDQALEEILGITNPEEFLENSGYYPPNKN